MAASASEACAQCPRQGQKCNGTKADAYRSTQLCRFFLAGTCKRSDCKFAHSAEDLKAPPNFWKSRLCEHFVRTGSCPNGASCKYAHGREEMKLATALRRQAKQAEKSTPQPIALPQLLAPYAQYMEHCRAYASLMSHAQAQVQVLKSQPDIRPPPGLEHLAPTAANGPRPALKLDLLLPEAAPSELSADDSSSKSPLRISLISDADSLESMSTTLQSSEKGWDSLFSSDDETGVLPSIELV